MTGSASAPPVRLVLLHHAGGSRLLYRGWERWLPAGWDVLALDAPGRGFHHDVPAPDGFEAMVDFVRDRALDGLGTRPLALFGHSMGGAIATELTNRLLAGIGPKPVWLGVSGWGAQRPAKATRRGGIDALSDDDLRTWLTAMGGTSESLLADPMLWQMFGPLLRKDLAVVGDYDPTADRSWLGVPLSLFGGHSDVTVSTRRLTDLADAAHRLVGLHLYQGDHFYLTDHAVDVARRIGADVRSSLLSGRGVTIRTKGV